MTRINKGRLWSAFAVVMILGVFSVPGQADATLLDPFGDGSVSLNVSITRDTSGFVYSYDIVNPDTKLFLLSVGTVDPLTLVSYGVVRFDAGFPATPTLTSNSLQLYFFSGLAQGSYDFSITYASLVDDQLMTFQKIGQNAKTIKAEYAPVPEPATLLLLGSGIIGLRFLSRRKREG